MKVLEHNYYRIRGGELTLITDVLSSFSGRTVECTHQELVIDNDSEVDETVTYLLPSGRLYNERDSQYDLVEHLSKETHPEMYL